LRIHFSCVYFDGGKTAQSASISSFASMRSCFYIREIWIHY
jgi:hypothetical protein